MILTLTGERDAFGELAHRYRRALFAVAYAVLGHREEAEDVAEDALFLALKALPMLKDPRRFASWVTAIARHRAIRVARNRSYLLLESDTNEPEILVQLHESGPGQIRIPHSRLYSALSSLPLPLREVITLRYFGSLSLREIGAVLELPISTVKWRLHEAKRRLKEALTGCDNAGIQKIATDKEGA